MASSSTPELYPQKKTQKIPQKFKCFEAYKNFYQIFEAKTLQRKEKVTMRAQISLLRMITADNDLEKLLKTKDICITCNG
jgi:hypothetical protein